MGEGTPVGGRIRILLASRQEVRGPPDLGRAAAAANRGSAQALLQVPAPFFVQPRKPLGALRTTPPLPTLGATRMSVVEECLMAYGARCEAMARRTADAVERMLQGTVPADRSVGRSDKCACSVNRKVVAPAHRARRDGTTADGGLRRTRLPQTPAKRPRAKVDIHAISIPRFLQDKDIFLVLPCSTEGGIFLGHDLSGAVTIKTYFLSLTII